MEINKLCTIAYFILTCYFLLLQGLLPGRRRYEDEWRTVYVLNKYPSNEPDVELKQKRYADNVIVTAKVRTINIK